MADTHQMAGGAESADGTYKLAEPPAKNRASPNVNDNLRADIMAMSKMTETAGHDVSKQEVEELVRRLTMDQMKRQWFLDEIVSKVKTELVESPELTTLTPATSEPSSPQPALAEPESPRWNKAYQATVEDETESQADADEGLKSDERTQDPAKDSIPANRNPPPAVASESAYSKVFNASSSRTTIQTPPESPHPSPKSRPNVRFSDRVPVVLQSRPPPRPRHSEPNIGRPITPAPDTKQASLSAVDLRWGALFNDRGEPTARLGQFLRGIGKYIAAEYSPLDSLVVTPEKLVVFYSKYKVESDALPFQHIFDARSRTAYDNLENLYQDLHCNYWLVSSRPGSKSTPCVPALTPAGFADWMIQQIQAFPDQEAKRLNRVIAELPIEADGQDGKSERLPKQLSRHLLPADRDRGIHQDVVTAANNWLVSAGFINPPRRRDSFRDSQDKTYRSSRKSMDFGDRDIIVSRHAPESDFRGAHGSSGHRRKSRDSYSRPGDRVYHRSGPSNRHVSRTHSEQMVRHPREPSPPTHRRTRSPVSNNRYRSSAQSLGSANDEYRLSSSSHHSGNGSAYSGSTFNPSSIDRTLDYVANYAEASRPSETTPRFVSGARRHSIALSTASQDDVGPTYEEYMRHNPRTSRNMVYNDGGSYHPNHSSGTG